MIEEEIYKVNDNFNYFMTIFFRSTLSPLPFKVSACQHFASDTPIISFFVAINDALISCDINYLSIYMYINHFLIYSVIGGIFKYLEINYLFHSLGTSGGFSVGGEGETRVCTGFSVGGEGETRVRCLLGSEGLGAPRPLATEVPRLVFLRCLKVASRVCLGS